MKIRKQTIFVQVCALIVILAVMFLTSCNKQIFDTNWNFDYAYVKLPNGQIVEGPLDSWNDFDSSDCVQVKINGIVYLTHYVNVVMIDR